MTKVQPQDGARTELTGRAGQQPNTFGAVHNDVGSNEVLWEWDMIHAEVFQNVVCVLDQKGPLPDAPWHFYYPNKHAEGKIKLRGSSIHVAALDRTDSSILSLILADGLARGRNRVNDICEYEARGDRGLMAPIHLAAVSGSIPVLNVLMAGKADVNAKARVGSEQDNTALHFAAVYNHPRFVRELMKYSPDLNGRNILGSTPLHSAAKKGAVAVARTLVENGASVNIEDDGVPRRTALACALEFGRVPHSKLYHFADRDLGDILLVAKLCPPAASAMVRDVDTGCADPSWSQAVDVDHPKATMSQWLELMRRAPQAALDVLETRLKDPEVESDRRNSLPRRALLSANENVRCYYGPDTKWASPAVNWQAELVPHDVWAQNHTFTHERMAAVRVKVLHMRGILNPDVLQVLATAPDEADAIFSNVITQAIIAHTWLCAVKASYIARVVRLFCEIVLLLWWVTESSPTDFEIRFCWGCFGALTYTSLVYLIMELVGHWKVLRRFDSYWCWKHGADWISSACSMFLLHRLWFDLHPQFSDRWEWELLSVVSLFRWIQITYSCRAFNYIGENILPILFSFSRIKSLSFITILLFVGFFHAFAAMRRTDSPWSGDLFYDTTIGTFRLLLLGDGDGIDMVLGLGESKDLAFAFLCVSVMIFCVCILNLFIAVHCEAYQQERDQASSSFLRERAAICLKYVLRPSWCWWPNDVWIRTLAAIALPVVAISAMSATLGDPQWHPCIFSVVCMVSFILSDSILQRRPWDESAPLHKFSWPKRGESDDNLLWICERVSDGAEEHADTQETLEQITDRLSALVEKASQLHKEGFSIGQPVDASPSAAKAPRQHSHQMAALMDAPRHSPNASTKQFSAMPGPKSLPSAPPAGDVLQTEAARQMILQQLLGSGDGAAQLARQLQGSQGEMQPVSSQHPYGCCGSAGPAAPAGQAAPSHPAAAAPAGCSAVRMLDISDGSRDEDIRLID